MPEPDLHDLFRRDLEQIELPAPTMWPPPTTHVARKRSSSLFAVPAAVAGMVVLALVAAVVIQIARGELPPRVGTAPSTSPSGQASPRPSVTPALPTGSPIAASPLPTSTVRPLATSDPVRFHNTLPAQGQWALILGWSGRGDWSGSIAAVPLSSTAPRDPLHLVSFATSADLESPYAGNLMRAQLSPDGRRIVLSVTVDQGGTTRLGLVIVDLVAGTARTVTADTAYHDVQPAWNPKGDEIAFVRISTTRGPIAQHPDAGLWIVKSDGSGLRRVLDPAPQPGSTYLYTWNAAGTALGFSQGDRGFGGRYRLLELATGKITQIGQHHAMFTTTRGIGDWREARPAFVGAFQEETIGRVQYVDTADDQLGSGARDVIVGPDELNIAFQFARWRPGSNDLLFVRMVFDDTVSPMRRTTTLIVSDANGRAPREIKTLVPARLMAAWTPDGREIVYAEALGTAAAVHLLAPDGTNDRLLGAFSGTPDSQIDWIDFAVLGF